MLYCTSLILQSCGLVPPIEALELLSVESEPRPSLGAQSSAAGLTIICHPRTFNWRGPGGIELGIFRTVRVGKGSI